MYITFLQLSYIEKTERIDVVWNEQQEKHPSTNIAEGKKHLFIGTNFFLISFSSVGIAGVFATVFHDGAMNPIEGVSSHMSHNLLLQ